MANLLMLLAGAVLCLEWLIDPAWAWWIMAQTVALFLLDLWWARRKYRLHERNYSTNMVAQANQGEGLDSCK